MVAIRTGSTLSYLISDHIGSNSITVSDTGTKTAETRYKAWGEVRYQSGTNPSDRTYTGQRSYASDFGLMYYNARWYDSYLNHFTQPDSIIPPGPQGYDRYAYVSNNPINRTDPTGHKEVCTTTRDDSGYISRECHDDGTPTFYNGYTEAELIAFSESQAGHPTGCWAFSLSMATNLYHGTHTQNGADVEWNMNIQGHTIVPGQGIPTWGAYPKMVQIYNPGSTVTSSANNTIADLKDTLANGSLPIVHISNQTDEQIRNDSHPTVGHVIVAVGYDKDNLYFLDPAEQYKGKLHVYTNDDFNKTWNETFNFFIAPGFMTTIR